MSPATPLAETYCHAMCGCPEHFPGLRAAADEITETPRVVRIDVAQKHAHRAARRHAKEVRISERRWRRKCFWMRPLGHAWKRIEDGYGYQTQRCAACGSARTKWFD